MPGPSMSCDDLLITGEVHRLHALRSAWVKQGVDVVAYHAAASACHAMQAAGACHAGM